MVAPVRIGLDGQDIFSVVQGLTRDVNLASFERYLADSASDITYTAAQFLAGYIERTGGTVETDTTPTAAAMLAALPNMEIEDCRLIIIRNANSGTLSLTGGSGVTIVGTATVATVTTAVYMLRKSSASAMTMTRLIAASY